MTGDVVDVAVDPRWRSYVGVDHALYLTATLADDLARLARQHDDGRITEVTLAVERAAQVLGSARVRAFAALNAPAPPLSALDEIVAALERPASDADLEVAGDVLVQGLRAASLASSILIRHPDGEILARNVVGAATLIKLALAMLELLGFTRLLDDEEVERMPTKRHDDGASDAEPPVPAIPPALPEPPVTSPEPGILPPRQVLLRRSDGVKGVDMPVSGRRWLAALQTARLSGWEPAGTIKLVAPEYAVSAAGGLTKTVRSRVTESGQRVGVLEEGAREHGLEPYLLPNRRIDPADARQLARFLPQTDVGVATVAALLRKAGQDGVACDTQPVY